jgi:RHS repeat-associated protein
VTTTYAYDTCKIGQLCSVLHQLNGTTLDGANYAFSFNGVSDNMNWKQKTDMRTGVNSGYVYDPLYQLQQVQQGAGTTENYSYDSVGNRLSSLNIPTLSYNASNELTADSSGSFSYDANGNTLGDASGRSFTWDYENRMTSATVPGVGTVSFKYDPFGRRIQKFSSSGTTNYIYDGANVIEQINSAGAILARFTDTQNVDEPLATTSSGVSNYYEQDGLGSVTSLTNSSGALAQSYTFDSFGNLTNSSGSVTNPFQYTGREFDSETGLYYYRARYYDPTTGRLTQEDPIGLLGGINSYAYVKGNPINFVDPSGESECPVHWAETLNAAHNAGMGLISSEWLAMRVCLQDFKWGTQGTNPNQTMKHSMAGDGEDCQTAYSRAVNFVNTTDNDAAALHALQDSYPSGHQYKQWVPGRFGLPSWEHFKGDWKWEPGAVAGTEDYLLRGPGNAANEMFGNPCACRSSEHAVASAAPNQQAMDQYYQNQAGKWLSNPGW